MKLFQWLWKQIEDVFILIGLLRLVGQKYDESEVVAKELYDASKAYLEWGAAGSKSHMDALKQGIRLQKALKAYEDTES